MATRPYIPEYAPTSSQPGMNGSRSGPDFASAIQRHWKLLLIPPLVLMTIALLIGLLRPPEYSAFTRLNVGRIDVPTQSIPGFVEGSQQLAASYSQAVDAQAVLEPLSNDLNLTTAELAERLSGSATPDSPTFIVAATGDSAESAVALANSGSRSLVDYVTRLNGSNPNGARLLRQYNDAARELSTAEARRDRLQDQLAAGGSDTLRARISQAEADIQTARLRRNTLNGLYDRSQQGQLSIDVVQVLSPATGATSDRRSVTSLLLFVGLVVGLIIGIALVARRVSAARA